MEAMRLAWDFFQNQILGMKWLSALTGRLLCCAGGGHHRALGRGGAVFYL